MKIEVSALFNTLAEEFVNAKAAEVKAVESRRGSAAQLLSLPEFVERQVKKGSVTLESDLWKVEAEYVETPVVDMAEAAKEMPKEYIGRIFVDVPTFSKSGLNALVKELTAGALKDSKKKKDLMRITAALEKYTVSRAGATQVRVSPVEPV